MQLKLGLGKGQLQLFLKFDNKSEENRRFVARPLFPPQARTVTTALPYLHLGSGSHRSEPGVRVVYGAHDLHG